MLVAVQAVQQQMSDGNENYWQRTKKRTYKSTILLVTIWNKTTKNSNCVDMCSYSIAIIEILNLNGKTGKTKILLHDKVQT